MQRYNRIMEIFWLVTAVVTLILGVYIIHKKGFADNWLFIFFPFLAAAMYAMRRHLRRKESGK